MPDPRFKFSNFQPCTVVGKDGIVSPSVEHFYVAAKTTDLEASERITGMSAGEAKRYGRTLNLRPGWDEMKGRVMLYGLRQKSPPAATTRALLAHDGELVELNTWHDLFWGCCTCQRHNGQGENRLGVLLAFVLQELLASLRPFACS